MLLDLNKIADEGISFDHRLALDDLEEAGGDPIPVGQARLRGRVERSGHRFDLTANLEASVRLVCGRCLEPYDLPISARFDLHLVRQESQPQARVVEADEEAAAAFVAPEGLADLRLMATEQIYLGLPMKRLCRPDCRGLCPTCGVNLNQETCGCREETTDPRLAPLKELRRRGAAGNGDSHA
jgi:uncharacterized protein